MATSVKVIVRILLFTHIRLKMIHKVSTYVYVHDPSLANRFLAYDSRHLFNVCPIFLVKDIPYLAQLTLKREIPLHERLSR